MKVASDGESKNLSWWTWVLPFPLFLIGAQVSTYFQLIQSASLIYFPVLFGLVFVHWWGWRVIIAFYLSALLIPLLWGYTNYLLLPLMATQQTLTIFLSWKLCRWKKIEVYSFSSTSHLIWFVVIGLIIPISFNVSYLFFTSLFNTENFWTNFLLIWFADFFTVFALAIPALYYLTPLAARYAGVQTDVKYPFGFEISKYTTRKYFIEFLLIASIMILLSQTITFEKYWFIYGVISVTVGMRYGFSIVILVNLFAYLLTYLLPYFNFLNDELGIKDTLLVNVHLGMSTICVAGVLIGRAMSDLWISREKLSMANEKLQVTNRELDRFVYSVSHDLTAPLKSVKGLINVIRLERDQNQMPEYVDMIEKSVVKLEDFITEVLDYSRSNRKEVLAEEIKIDPLINEILDNYRYMDSFEKLYIHTRYDILSVKTDRFLFKLIMNNLISNAIKYQRNQHDHTPEISITTHRVNGSIKVGVSDNGTGIKEDSKNHLFTMFYRGDSSTYGSGLGLYIAKVSAERINAKIEVDSVYGSGSTFTVTIND
ncbi:MAG: hypothetical protein HC811_09880 [Flammeovirgaceae bacterium]|nr:hypothetical protein [Flammeovirgaceae bacterium]